MFRSPAKLSRFCANFNQSAARRAMCSHRSAHERARCLRTQSTPDCGGFSTCVHRARLTRPDRPLWLTRSTNAKLAGICHRQLECSGRLRVHLPDGSGNLGYPEGDRYAFRFGPHDIGATENSPKAPRLRGNTVILRKTRREKYHCLKRNPKRLQNGTGYVRPNAIVSGILTEHRPDEDLSP